ncbi:MAG: mechanosensitive ion channel family protein [Tetrasphaera sp.]
MSRAETWEWFQGVPIRILATILLAVALRWLLHRVIRRAVDLAISRGDADRNRAERVLAHATGWSRERHRQRLATLGTLLRSTVTLVVSLIAGLTVMSLLDIPLAPLLASAGVGGVALGFGAQSLVKDFLSGIFMIMEDQYGVGDVIDTGEAIGTVVDVTLRVTTVRDANGVTWYVRNGEILRIGNKSQGWATAYVDLPIAYDADVDDALRVLAESATAFAADPQWSAQLVEPPQVLGVESILGATLTLRILVKCTAGAEFDIQRELRRRAKDALDLAGIPGPRLAFPPDQGATP